MFDILVGAAELPDVVVALIVEDITEFENTVSIIVDRLDLFDGHLQKIGDAGDGLEEFVFDVEQGKAGGGGAHNPIVMPVGEQEGGVGQDVQL